MISDAEFERRMDALDRANPGPKQRVIARILARRINAALAALAAAPDVDPSRARVSQSEVKGLVQALTLAWVALNPDVPSSKRGADTEPPKGAETV